MQMVYMFDEASEDRLVLGNKGANLVTMTKLGLPVPPGFVVSIDAFHEYRRSRELPTEQLEQGVARLAQRVGRDFCQGLAVSVRSSAPASMPGMMDTVLNIRDKEGMLSAVRRVFDSWDNPRAAEYRRLNRIPHQMGTAAVVQAMVFGDRDEASGTGVVFTRNPSTGEKGLFGEYLMRAQGEELVSGTRTPSPIEGLRSHMPQVYAQLEQVARLLEEHFRDMQDIEFTIESGKLYILQTRSGKRGGQSAVKIAVDMARDGLISKEEALLRVTADDLRALLHKRVASPERFQPLACGLAAAPGATTGKVVFDPLEASNWTKMYGSIVLVRPETSPDDIQGIAAAHGVLTSKGGLTSHAAIVTRAMGRPCICGAEDIRIDLEAERFEAGGKVVCKGDIITIDGNTGKVYLGALPLVEAATTPESAEIMTWAEGAKRMGVRANADTVEMIAEAKRLGVEGIGLCRTERQFNAPERLAQIRQFILAETAQDIKDSLDGLRRLQKADFVAIFEELQGMPIIIRLLDLPLHEFLPPETETTDPLLKKRMQELRETNPMLGHRGVRLSVTRPEIYQMQIDAIMEAKAEVDANVSIMIPQVITLQELLWVRQYVQDPDIKVGIMMETVRACMRAGRLAEVADFFSFGTNDLTQAVYSFSREDVEKKFLSTYLRLGILRDNPFEILDVKGVGRLMETAIYWARKAKPDIEIGVCGEHAGEPNSIRFFEQIGIDYISCSPFRIPVAKLAAAQAAIEERSRSETAALGEGA
ncbi:MAG TPA: pyruvate, phosphate dikinase [Dehalococcoidia bacterium]|nr:pyruvate, phosphate dikinase [Dehalococcoidia bacterium]